MCFSIFDVFLAKEFLSSKVGDFVIFKKDTEGLNISHVLVGGDKTTFQDGNRATIRLLGTLRKEEDKVHLTDGKLHKDSVPFTNYNDIIDMLPMGFRAFVVGVTGYANAETCKLYRNTCRGKKEEDLLPEHRDTLLRIKSLYKMETGKNA